MCDIITKNYEKKDYFKMNAKISVIIPVYNTSDYLDKCLWSVTNQTFKELEIIVVNDGSSDDSPSIIQKYAEQDSRIKVISKKNEGLVMARKSGLEIATCDYIHHFDGDDYLELNCYELLYKRAIETDADITVMKFWFDNIEQNVLTESEFYGLSESENLWFLKNIWTGRGYFCVWQYIHKRSLYSNPIIFCENLSLGEDAFLTSQLAYYSTKIAYVNLPLYHYIIRASSLFHTAMTDKKAADMMLYPTLIKEFMEEKPEYRNLEEFILDLEAQSCYRLLKEHYFKGASSRCKRSVAIFEQYPAIAEPYKKLRKLYKAFAISQFAGLLYANYYIRKGKL